VVRSRLGAVLAPSGSQGHMRRCSACFKRHPRGLRPPPRASLTFFLQERGVECTSADSGRCGCLNAVFSMTATWWHLAGEGVDGSQTQLPGRGHLPSWPTTERSLMCICWGHGLRRHMDRPQLWSPFNMMLIFCHSSIVLYFSAYSYFLV
jgi:hypothetical protein